MTITETVMCMFLWQNIKEFTFLKSEPLNKKSIGNIVTA
jgi:hypothetical protein